MRPTKIARSAKALVEANASHNVYTNGMTAINLPSNGAAARITVSLNAGARNETAANIGAASFTRNCIGASNYRNTAFLQNKMASLMGATVSTSGTRERTIVNITAGPKAIEELAMDVLVPSLTQPVFFKWETTNAWDQAKHQGECPIMEAFHAASFKGGLANNLAFKGGYGDENPMFYSEREELLESLAKTFHENNYGVEGATVIGCGVSDALLEKVVTALQGSPFGNAAPAADGFRAGEVRVLKAGPSVAVVGADVTGADPAAAAVLAAALNGSVITYSDCSVLKFSARSAQELTEKLASLTGSLDFVAAQANASLTEALKLNSNDALAVKNVAEGARIVDAGAATQDAVMELAAAVASAPKSMVVVGDTHAFPHNSDI